MIDYFTLYYRNKYKDKSVNWNTIEYLYTTEAVQRLMVNNSLKLYERNADRLNSRLKQINRNNK